MDVTPNSAGTAEQGGVCLEPRKGAVSLAKFVQAVGMESQLARIQLSALPAQ